MNLHEYQAKQLFEHYGLPVKMGQSVNLLRMSIWYWLNFQAISGRRNAKFMLVGVVKRVALNWYRM